MVSWDGEPYIYNRLGTRDNLLFPGLFRGIGTVRFWYTAKVNRILLPPKKLDDANSPLANLLPGVGARLALER